MEKILNKIKNHEYLNNDDITRFIQIHSNGKVKTCFLDNVKEKLGIYELGYVPEFSTILVDKKINNHFEELLLKTTELDKSEFNCFFIVDFCNIYLLTSLFHELEHVKQFTDEKNHLCCRNRIIKENIKFIHINPNLYAFNHDLYYHEYDAEIKAYIKTMKVINSNYIKLDENSIFEFNSIVAKIIYHSYGNRYKNGTETKNYEKFQSPISYTKHLSSIWNAPKERQILLNCIKKMKNKSTTEYNKLLNGLEVSPDVISVLYDIVKKQISTKNIFDEIKQIDRIKLTNNQESEKQKNKMIIKRNR